MTPFVAPRARARALRCVAMAIGLVVAGGCGTVARQAAKAAGTAAIKNTAERTATQRRDRARRRGPAMSTIPQQARPTVEVLGDALLVGIHDARSGLFADPMAQDDEVAWVAAVITGGDEHNARLLVRIRRAAFGTHVPAAGERAPIDEDVLDDRGLGVAADVIVLLGPQGPCPAHRDTAVVTALNTGGHTIGVRWPLLGCGPGPWAPVGLVAQGLPHGLRWDPPVCDEPNAHAESWRATGVPEAQQLGAVLHGEAVVALVGDGALWLPTAAGWISRPFMIPGAVLRPCGGDAEATGYDAGEDAGDETMMDPDSTDADDPIESDTLDGPDDES